MAKTLEGYSQEVGRAGRDGLPSTCLMFLSAVDIPVLEGFARGDTPSQKDLQLWMQEVALKDPAKDGSLDFNHYQQSKTCANFIQHVKEKQLTSTSATIYGYGNVILVVSSTYFSYSSQIL